MSFRKISSSLLARLFVVFVAGLCSSCSEDEQNLFVEETITLSGSLGALEAYDAIEIDYIIEAAMKSTRSNYLTDVTNCFAFINTESTKSISLNFGNECLSPIYPFNRRRTGIIKVSYPNVIADTLTGRIITFDNYVVRKRKIEGTIEMKNVVRDANQYISATIDFTDFKVSFPDGSTATYNGSQRRVWVSGENFGRSNDNKYLVVDDSAPLAGTTSDGHSFTSTISGAVQLNFACADGGKYFGYAGVISLPSLSGFPARKRQVDLGASACDSTVVITTWDRSWTTNTR